MKQGSKPKGSVAIKWGKQFAYGIGLLVADGCLSKDGRHIDLTSKDYEQLEAFNMCMGIDKKISAKFSGIGTKAYHVQFSDVLFYKFLMKIGLSPAKSKILGEIYVPQRFFFDFLRGYFDGDGCSYSYYDPIFKNSYRFYITFASGSERFFVWLRKRLIEQAGVIGFINRRKGSTNVQLKFSKREAEIIAKKMYYHPSAICLERKRLKVLKSLGEMNSCRSGGIGRHAAFRSP